MPRNSLGVAAGRSKYFGSFAVRRDFVGTPFWASADPGRAEARPYKCCDRYKYCLILNPGEQGWG